MPCSLDDHVTAIHDQGYSIVRGLFSKASCERVLDRLAYLAEHAEFYGTHGVRFWPEPGADPADPDPLARLCAIQNQIWCDPVYWQEIITAPALVELVHAMLKDDYVVNNVGIFTKPAKHGSGVPWHQDSGVWGMAEQWDAADRPFIFDYWFALEDADEDNGCLKLLPGSQRHGVLPHGQHGGILKELDPRVYGHDPADAVSCPCQAGDLIVWHQDMFHDSGPNRSDRRRIGGVGTFVADRDRERMMALRPGTETLRNAFVYRGGIIQDLHNPLPMQAG